MSERDKEREANKILAKAGYRRDGRKIGTAVGAAKDVMVRSVRCGFCGRGR